MLERDHTGPFESIILTSCKSMKAIRTKASQQQGVKKTYDASLETSRRTLEKSFSTLELKGKEVKIFPPNRDCKEVIAALQKIEPMISEDATIPHARPKFRNFPSLREFFENHMKEGLYLLQFRKCDDLTFFSKTID